MLCRFPITINELQVPCGTCGFCLKTRASNWTFRLQQEALISDYAYVALLTYNDEHLVYGDSEIDGNTYPILHKPDLQKFFKRLRKWTSKRENSKPIRFFAVGEYGGKYKRPHYHAIIFNATQEEIYKAWELNSEALGIVFVKQLREGGLGYLTTYFMLENEWPIQKGLPKQFAVMSRNPGLGNNYLTGKSIRWHKDGLKNYTRRKGVYGNLPRYYRDKIFSKEEMSLIQEQAMYYAESEDEPIEVSRRRNSLILKLMKNSKEHK